MIAGSYSYRDEKDAKEIMKRLDGSYDPPHLASTGKQRGQKEIEEQILKAKLNNFFNSPH